MSRANEDPPPGATDPRRFWQVYTPGNIAREIRYRLSTRRDESDRDGPDDAGESSAPPAPYDGSHAREVGRFYDRHHEDFLSVYGDVIQAFRTRDTTNLLTYLSDSMRLAPGLRVLDAGCGVGTPAVFFARHAGVAVDGITISERQRAAAVERVERDGLEDRVRIVLGDYHRMRDQLEAGAYDVVCFLESFGHSRDKTRLLSECWEMLKPGGLLYVKDLFRRVSSRSSDERAIDHEIAKINQAYRYEVADLGEVLDGVRRQGFILSALETVDLDLADFEDLAISNRFQELTGLAQIEDWSRYVFPVDFFELKARKPDFDPERRPDRHFLQNLYHQRAGDPR